MFLYKCKEMRARTTPRGNEAMRLMKTFSPLVALAGSFSPADIEHDSETESKCLMVLFDRGGKKRCRTDPKREKLVWSAGGVVCEFMRIYVGVRE